MRRSLSDTDADAALDLISPPPPSPTLTARLTRRTSVSAVHEPVGRASWVGGLGAGVAQAAVFNPYDRALYLSVTNRRPFLRRDNWRAPYTGVLQSLGGRALAGGLYFPLEHSFLRCFKENHFSHDPATHFLAGTAAGAVNAMLLNPMSAVKYKTWSRTANPGMWREAFGMLRKSGSLRPFGNGMLPTVYRDVVFGGCYTWLRLQLQWAWELPPHQQYWGNLFAAALATVLSGPFNYARNIQYATKSEIKAESTITVLGKLVDEIRLERTFWRQAVLLQSRLRIGWGTARVALGMTFAHAVYDRLHEELLLSGKFSGAS